MENVSIKFDLSKFEKYAKSLIDEPVDDACRKQWLARYSAYVRKRFVNRGDGDWAPLAESTIKRRRKNSDVPLRNNGILLAALSIGGKGNHAKSIPDGVEYGFADTPHEGSKKSIRQIAIIHDQGLGNNPKREILIEPDQNLIDAMSSDLVRSLERREPKS
jgi:hypothetical protein